MGEKTYGVVYRMTSQHGGNDNHNFYSLIKNDTGKKRQLVENNPEVAQRMFYVFGDREIGELFVARYSEDPVRHHSAYHISVDLGRPIKRQLTEDPTNYPYRPTNFLIKEPKSVCQLSDVSTNWLGNISRQSSGVILRNGEPLLDERPLTERINEGDLEMADIAPHDITGINKVYKKGLRNSRNC